MSTPSRFAWEDEIPQYAPTVFVNTGDRYAGIFVKAELGPVGEFGAPIIVTFAAIEGEVSSGKDGDTGTVKFSLVKGEEYSHWLLNTVSRNVFMENKPKPGEKYYFRNEGERPFKDKRVDPKTKELQTYWDVTMHMPDRHVVEKTFSWDDVDTQSPSAPF